MPLQPASGAKDLNPQQVESNQNLTKQLSDIYRLWGYEEVSPPRVERIDTLMAGGAIESDEIVRLVSSEPLGLRPEMTASIARAACTRLSKRNRPLRLWTTGMVFQGKESVDGGFSIEEHLQSGVELFGVKDISAEMELLSLLLKSMEIVELNKHTKPTLLIGHTGLLNLILDSVNDFSLEIIRDTLVKFNYLGLENLELDKNTKELLVEIQKIRGKPTDVINTMEDKYGPNEVIEELKRIFKIIEPLADQYGIRLQLDPTFQPHFELYNGIVFQFICERDTYPLVIARGGRYDELVKKCGASEDTASGLGFSISIDKIQEVRSYRQDNINETSSILITYGPKSNLEEALKRQRLLHEKGIRAVIELEQCKNKDQAIKLLGQRRCTQIDWIE